MWPDALNGHRRMQYVPSLPPIGTPTPDSGAVKAVAHVAAIPGITEQTATAYRPLTNPAPLPAISRRWVPRPTMDETERRTYCRRIHDAPVLEELRSGMDRRRHNQRKSDLTTAIDEIV